MIKELCIGLLEISSIALGIKCLDAMIKRSPIQVIKAFTLCPGKYLILITADVASVEESLKAGKKIAGNFLIDELFLPTTDYQVYQAITGTNKINTLDSIGIIETYSVASSIIAADISTKTSDISIIEFKIATMLGGKSYFTINGVLSNVEAAIERVSMSNSINNKLVNQVIIPAPHIDMFKFIS